MNSEVFKDFIDEEFNLKDADRDFIAECIIRILSMEVINETVLS